MNNLKEMLIAKGWRPDGKLLAHWMPWFGDGTYHPMSRYNSSDPSVVSQQLDVMQAVGVDGVVVTWQGTNKASSQLATLEMAAQTSARGMLFCLLADPNLLVAGPTPDAAVLAQLTNTDGLNLLRAPSYLPERYFLDFTGSAFNFATLTAAMQPYVPGFNVLGEHKGYSWPNIPFVLSDWQKENTTAGMAIPGLFCKFFDGGNLTADATLVSASRGDGTGVDFNTRSFDAKSANKKDSRQILEQAGNTFFDCLASVPLTAKYLALVTWNDYNEGTPWETYLSIMAGIRVGN